MKRIYINNDWFFNDTFEKKMLGAEYDFTENEKVRIPHTVKETPLHYFDEHEYQKEAVYFKTINIPEEWMGKDIYLTFEGVLHSCIVYINGNAAKEHKCGYTAFSVLLNEYVNYGEENLITVKADSREDQNIPPFGFVIDYMTYGGIYRDVYIDVKESSHINDCFVSADMDGTVNAIFETSKDADGKTLECEVVSLKKIQFGKYAEEDVINKDSVKIEKKPTEKNESKNETGESTEEKKSETGITLKCKDIKLWSPDEPNLYLFKVRLKDEEKVLDETEVRFGFRRAVFEKDGFYLNGNKLKIRGLNRHQSYAYVGYAMPENPQRNDALILKNELGLNAVRTSHYPQSHYFLDACDELGLLVFTEIPGWQHIGDDEWKDVAVRNVEDMVKQYRNHTSIILWGVRINESVDDDEFYKRTNEVAHKNDPTRQTGGVRCYKKSHLFEDVYTYNDFVHSGNNQGCDKKTSVTSDVNKGYLISEYMGHMFPTKAFDWEEHRLEDAMRHARVLNDVSKNDDIAGSFGWCMFDYNTHKDFGSGDRICYHGVCDMFRNPKMAAYVYAEMQDETPVLELSSSMDIGEHPGCNRNETYIFTNADSVKMYKNDDFIKEYKHDFKEFPNLKNPPIKIDDYIGDALEKKENMKEAQAKDVKAILNEVAKFGLYKMSFSTKLKAAKMMLLYHMKTDDAVALYNKYIGDWGGSATTYRFEAIKDGKVVKEIRKTPMTKVHFEVSSDRNELVEGHSYDVASVRIKAVDENGNVLNYYNDPVVLSIEGDAEIIGPKIACLSAGMGGTYVKSIGKSGKVRLIIKDSSEAEMCGIEFNIINA